MSESFLYTEIEDLRQEIANIHTSSVSSKEEAKQYSYSLFDSLIETKEPTPPLRNSINVFDRLSRPKVRYTSEVDSQASVTTEVMNELTFVPNTMKSKASYKTLHLKEKNGAHKPIEFKPKTSDVVNRLMDAGKESKLNLRNKRLKQNVQDAANCTFQPSLCETSRKLLSKKSYVPLSDLKRQEMIRNKKFNETEKLRQEQIKANAATFMPHKFSKNKNFLVPEAERISIYDRVANYNSRENAKKNWLCAENLEANFIPVINARSRKIASEMFDYEDVHHKLHALHDEGEKRKEIKRNMNVATFQPKINPLSKLIANRMTLDRNRDVKVVVDSNCTFKPKLNRLSRLLVEENRKTLIEKTATEKPDSMPEPEEKADAFPFKPKINENINVEDVKNYINLANPKLLSERIYLQQSRKEKRIEELKKELLKERQKEETFKPVTNKLKKHVDPVVVKGLGTYLARQDRAKTAAKEQQAYEDKIFYNTRGSYKTKTSLALTTPKPFKLNRKQKQPERKCYLAP